MAWICDKNGNRKCEIKKLSYNGTFMEVSSITVTVESPTPIDFAIGDYIDWDYDGLRYSLDTAAGVEKQARRNTIGQAFVYENLVFLSPLQAANNVDFLDVVIGNTVDFMTNTEFSFYGTAWDYAKRLEANLCRLYGEGAWKVRIWTNGVCYDTAPAVSIDTGAWENKLVEVSKIKCLGGFQQIYDLWGCAYVFSVENGVNYVDFYDDFEQYAKAWKQGGVDKIFAYGKSNGLYKIRHTPDADHLLVTRLRAYGSAENLPANYYLNSPLYHVDGNESSELAIANLMLPASEWTKDGVKAPVNAYLEQNTDIYGVREASVAWDGSDEELGEIKPSIYGLTIQDLLDLMSPGDSYRPIVAKWPDTSQRIDKIITGAAPADNGAVAESGYDFTVVEAQGVFSANELSAARVYNIVDFGDLTMATIPSVDHLADYRVVPTSENVKVASFDVPASVIGLITDVNAYITPYVNGVKVDDATIPCMVSSEVISREVSGVEYTKRYYIHLLDTNSAAVVFSTMRTGAVTFKIQANITYSGQANQVTVLRNEYAVNFNLLRGNKAIDKFFSVIIPQIGFDLSAAMTGSAKLCMRSGYNQPREFPIVASSVRYDSATDTWYLRCKRVVDQSTKTYFPNSDAIIATGDEYYFSGIAMPALYVEIAARKLLAAARAWLELHSKPRMLSSVDVDNKIMAAEGIVLREGMSLPIDDDDLSISPETQESRIIDNIRIEEGDNSIRTFSVTLRDKKERSSIDSAIRGATSGLATSASVSEAVSAAESKDHGALTGRDMPNQHPISAITGLEDALASISFFEEDGSGNVKLKDEYGGLWAKGFGSFGGIGSGGPGGGGSLLDMWVSLKNNDDDYADWLINAHHLPLGNGLSIDPETGLINVSGGAAGGVTSVAGVLPVNGDVQKGTLQEALGIDLLGAIAQSLQAQIDSVSTKNGFDELAATSLFAETAAIQNLYAEILHTESLSAKNIDLNGLSLTNTNGVLSMNGNALLSALANEGNNIAITVGGKKLTLEVGYAKKALGDKNGNDIYATYVSGVAIGTDTRKDNVLVSKAGATAALTIPYATVSPNTRFTYTIGSTTYANAEFPVDWFVPEEYESGKYRLRLNPKYEGLYSDGWVAAGGVGSHSGGGGGGVVEQLYRFSDLGGSFDDAANDAFNAYTVNALYLRIVALESRPAGGVTSVAGMVGDVTTASLASALGITNLNNNLTTISDCLQSLQSQIDAVATRDMYDELTATAFYAEAVSAQDIHASSFYLNGADINSVFASKLTFAANALRLVSKNDTVLTVLTGANLVTVLDSNAVNNVKTEVDNANTLYLVGVTSAATTALKRNTLVTVTGGAMALASVAATGQISAGSFKLASGEPTLSWDSDNNAWHLSGNFYADGWIAAGGVGSSGSGGTTDLLSVWASLTGNDDDFADWSIHPGHLPSIAIIGNGITGTGAYAYDATTRLGTATLNLSLSPSGVTAGTYSSVTVDAYGRVVNGTNEDISVYLQSLQSQIDSVAAQNNYDELTATSLFADMLAASTAYFETMESESIGVKNIMLGGTTLANSGGILQWNSSPLFSSLTTSGTTITAVIGGQSRTHTISASDIVNTLGATPVNRATADANGNNIASTYKTIASLKSKGTATLPVYFDAGGNAQTITSYEGNAATASRLQGTGTYTAWGQTYWENGVPKSIDGDITPGTAGAYNLGSLSKYWNRAYIYRNTVGRIDGIEDDVPIDLGTSLSPINGVSLGSSSHRFVNIYGQNEDLSGSLSVSGLSTLSGGLLVSTTPKVYFGDTDKYLELVNIGTNESPIWALHSNVGFYSDNFVTAGGVQGGGEAPTDLLTVWSSLIGNDDDYAGWNINPGHLPAIVISGNGITGTGSYYYNDTNRAATATLSLALVATGVAAGTYRSVTVDAYGRAVSGTNPTTIAGYGITDAYTKTEVDALIAGINLSAITETLQSLQSQIDSVASRNNFDELTAATLYADIAAISSLYAGSIIIDGDDLTSRLGTFVTKTTTVNGHALSGNVTVTKADVGLGNVENTALSTWPGTNYITNLGTITTGVWHGTPIANDYLANKTIGVGGAVITLGGSATLTQIGIPAWAQKASIDFADMPAMYIGNARVQSSAQTAQNIGGIGTITASGLATITGGISLGGTFNSDTSKLVWDETNNAWHLIGNFYADGFIAAGGVGSDGGGDVDLPRVWESLTNNTDFPNTEINPAHIPDMAYTYGYLKGNQQITLTGVVTGSGTTSIATSIADGALSIAKVSGLQAALDSKTGNTGTVTSVGLSVPTGLSVSGSPITTSGTLAISLASGYSIPTTAQQSAWNGKQDAISDLSTIRSNAANGATAYSWGNHANAGYLTSADSTTISRALQSLQSQIDSVAARDMFDELSVTVLYTDTLSVGSDFGIGGNVTIGGALGVTGETNIYSTLRVSGATTLSSTLEVTGATTVWGRLGVGGSASSPLMFYVNGSAGIQNALTVTGATTLSGATAVNNTLTVGTSTTNRATTLNGTLYVSDNTTVMGRLGVGAAASSPLMFYVSGKSGLDGDTSIGGSLTVGTASANKNTTLNGMLSVSGATTITNALTVGTTANNYATTLYGSLTVGTSSTNRPTLLYGDLTVGQSSATRATKLYGTLSVSSDTTVSGRLGVGGAASSPLMLYVNGKAGIQDDTTIGGSLTIGSPSANKNALVYGYLYIGSATSYIRYDGTGLYSNVGFASASYITAGGVASSSDIRLKDEIEDVCSDRALAVLMQLKPKEWVWNEKNDYFSGKRGAGLVAQDVEDVLPFAVMETGEYKSLNYSVLHAYEIAGLQNHEERIAELEKENKELKEKLEAYAAR